MARAAGINELRWIPAVDGRATGEPCLSGFDVSFIKCRWVQRMAQKRLGQACSAVRTMEYILSTAESTNMTTSGYLLLEDDVKYTPSPRLFKALWDVLRDHLLSGKLGPWDVINLGPCGEHISKLNKCVMIGKGKTPSLWLTLSVHPMCTQGLVVSHSGALKLKALVETFRGEYFAKLKQVILSRHTNQSCAVFPELVTGYDSVMPAAIATGELSAYSTWPILVEQVNYAHTIPQSCLRLQRQRV